MGIISLINTDKLFWLGRYTERVYTTIRLFGELFDKLIEGHLDSIDGFCRSLDIPNIYTSGEDFVERYLFDPQNPDSIISNLTRAYDNSITLREEIGSECISYIQLAVYEMNSLHGNQSPMIGLQRIVDYILAFWGLVDDLIPDENTRNIIKTGKRIERLDLYTRLHRPKTDIQREIHRLAVRISRTTLSYKQANIDSLNHAADEEDVNYPAMLSLVDNLVAL